MYRKYFHAAGLAALAWLSVVAFRPRTEPATALFAGERGVDDDARPVEGERPHRSALQVRRQVDATPLGRREIRAVDHHGDVAREGAAGQRLALSQQSVR